MWNSPCGVPSHSPPSRAAAVAVIRSVPSSWRSRRGPSTCEPTPRPSSRVPPVAHTTPGGRHRQVVPIGLGHVVGHLVAPRVDAPHRCRRRVADPWRLPCLDVGNDHRASGQGVQPRHQPAGSDPDRSRGGRDGVDQGNDRDYGRHRALGPCQGGPPPGASSTQHPTRRETQSDIANWRSRGTPSVNAPETGLGRWSGGSAAPAGSSANSCAGRPGERRWRRWH